MHVLALMKRSHARAFTANSSKQETEQKGRMSLLRTCRSCSQKIWTISKNMELSTPLRNSTSGIASPAQIQTRHMSGNNRSQVCIWEICCTKGDFRREDHGVGGHHGPGVTYEGLTLHKPARWHVIAGEGFAAAMWWDTEPSICNN